MRFAENVNLAKYCNYRIGGPAGFFFEAKTADEARWAAEEARRLNLPIFILGGGTNVLISEKGFDGLVLKPNLDFIEIADSGRHSADSSARLAADGPLRRRRSEVGESRQGQNVRVGAGVLIAELLNYSIKNSLSGLEWAGGLPGTLGGAIRGNAGCFGGEIKDVVSEVESLDIGTGEIRRRDSPECRFAYRSSIFKENDGKEVILSATFLLRPGDQEKIRRSVEEKIEYRKSRHPLEYPNVGSMFKNVDLRKAPPELHPRVAHVVKVDPFPVIPTAYLVSEAGLKGVSFGGAMISPKHPNFIVNALDAKSHEILSLIGLVKGEVKNKFGIELEEEVRIV